MVKNNKKIVLLLAGGTLLLDKNKRLLAVDSSEDIALWLEQMPELNLFGNIEPFFICAEDELLTPKHWEKMAAIISEHSESSAFVIVSRTDQLPMTASALSFLLQNIKKTVVLTAALSSGTSLLDKKNILNKKNDLGLRSNLINAFQVSEYKLPSPAIMFGTRLIPGVKAVTDQNSEVSLFASQDDSYWGRVDFGISVKSGLAYHQNLEKIYKKIDSNILVLDDIPGSQLLLDPEQIKKYEAVFVRLQHQNNMEDYKIRLLKNCERPIFIYHPIQVVPFGDGICISNCTFEAALAKAMWFVANSDSLGVASKVMDKNLIGELSSLK